MKCDQHPVKHTGTLNLELTDWVHVCTCPTFSFCHRNELIIISVSVMPVIASFHRSEVHTGDSAMMISSLHPSPLQIHLKCLCPRGPNVAQKLAVLESVKVCIIYFILFLYRIVILIVFTKTITASVCSVIFAWMHFPKAVHLLYARSKKCLQPLTSLTNQPVQAYSQVMLILVIVWNKN